MKDGHAKQRVQVFNMATLQCNDRS